MPEPEIASPMPGVAVVAADRRVRDSLASLLAATGGCCVVGTAGDVEAAGSLIDTIHPDVIVLDPRLVSPGDGELVSRLRAGAPDARILVVESDGEHHLSVLVHGADGLLDANAQPAELRAILGAPPHDGGPATSATD